MPAQVLLGLGMGTAFAAGMSLATYGVEPHEAGVASAMLNTFQQVGGSIGTALLNTIAASAAAGWAADHVARTGDTTSQLQAATHGYTTVFWWAAAILTVAAAVIVICVRAGEQRPSELAGEDTNNPAYVADDTDQIRTVLSH